MVANVSYVFGMFLKKEIAVRSDEIAEMIDELIKQHFDSRPRDKLKSAQIHRFTGIAYSSDNTKSLQEFVERQAGKERKARKGPWTASGLDKTILSRIKEITGTDSKQVYETALGRTRESMGNATEEFDKANRKKHIHDISIELLKRFATHFGIHYLHKGG